jgi:hypothetical protein
VPSTAPGDEPHRYFFLHLQKTGGSSLNLRLRDCFGATAVFPTREEQEGVTAVVDVDHLLAQFRLRRDAIRVIVGHFPLCITDVLGVPLTTFTVLRDPVERTLSLLRRRSTIAGTFQGRDLEDIYADAELRDIIDNHMVKLLSLDAAEMESTPLVQVVAFDDERLATAKHNLEHRIDTFGLQEHLDDFCYELSQRYGWDLGAARVANRTAHVPVSDELRQRIAQDNRYDVELYAFATELWHERRERVRSPELATDRRQQ